MEFATQSGFSLSSHDRHHVSRTYSSVADNFYSGAIMSLSIINRFLPRTNVTSVNVDQVTRSNRRQVSNPVEAEPATAERRIPLHGNTAKSLHTRLINTMQSLTTGSITNNLKKKWSDASQCAVRSGGRAVKNSRLTRKSYREYKQELDRWANVNCDNGKIDKARRDAAKRIIEWCEMRLKDNYWEYPLKLPEVGLYEIPPLPPGVQTVDLRENLITRLAGLGKLPESLARLDLTDNPFRKVDLEDVANINPSLIVHFKNTEFSPSEIRTIKSHSPNLLFEDSAPFVPVLNAVNPTGINGSANQSNASNSSSSEVSSLGPDSLRTSLGLSATSRESHVLSAADNAFVTRSTAAKLSARLKSTDASASMSKPISKPLPTIPQSGFVTANQGMRGEVTLMPIELQNWIGQGAAQGGNRAEAVSRIMKWRRNSIRSDDDLPLDLSNLDLNEIPPWLPSNLTTFNFENNRLTQAPLLSSLPRSLLTLNLDGNPIEQLSPDYLSMNRGDLIITIDGARLNKLDRRNLALANEEKTGPIYVIRDLKPEGK